MGFEFGPWAFGKERMQERNAIREKIAVAQKLDQSGKSLQELSQLHDWLDPDRNLHLKKFLKEVDDVVPWKRNLTLAGVGLALLGPLWLPLAIVGTLTALSMAATIVIDSFDEDKANKAALARAAENINNIYRDVVRRKEELNLTQQKLDLVKARFGNDPAAADAALQAAFGTAGKTAAQAKQSGQEVLQQPLFGRDTGPGASAKSADQSRHSL